MNAPWFITTALLLALCQQDAGSAAGPGVAAAEQTPREILATALRRFDEAVALRDQNSPQARRLYHAALAGFESLIHDGLRNGHLYYNTANARLRLGQIGPAIASYRRALRLLPGDENIRRNLAFARSLCEVRIEPTAGAAIAETLLFWHFETSPRARSWVALAAYAAFWGLLFVRLLSRRRWAIAGWLAGVAAVVALAAGTSVAWSTYAASFREGVTIGDAVVLRKGNGEGYQPQLDRPLPEGVEFRILEQRDDVEANRWYHVELRDGKDGWLRADQAEII